MMREKNELLVRKRLRLKNYNYNQKGAYFITICTEDRRELLGSIVGGADLGVPYMRLSKCGEVVDDCVRKIGLHYDVVVEKYVIMPNHLHMIVLVRGGTSGSTSPTSRAVIPSLVSGLKRVTNKIMGVGIWQRSYHDHIIRDERDYLEYWRYVDENVARWVLDRYHVD